MNGIHFSDNIIALIFSLYFSFAIWAALKLWAIDIKMTKLCEQIKSLNEHTKHFIWRLEHSRHYVEYREAEGDRNGHS